MKKIIKKTNEYLIIKDLAPVEAYLSTGCIILDLAIADRLPGGFGVGRISHVYGEESSAKTVLALEPLGSAQRQGGEAFFVDAEMTMDGERAKNLFGVDISELNYISTGNTENLTVEWLFDTLIPECEKRAKENKRPIAISIDSLSAIPSKNEMEETIDKATYGTSRAKSLSKGFRKHIWELAKTGTTMIFIDQARIDLNTLFTKRLTFSGGQALKFYASTRVIVKHQDDIKDKNENIIGIRVHFKVEKNKIAVPLRSGTFRLLFDYGIDYIGTSIEWLKYMNRFEWKGFYLILGEKFRELNKAISYVEENNSEKELQEEVYNLWRETRQKLGATRKVRERC